jgi:hypothetical protein
MMMAKSHALARELPQRRTIALADEVGPHAVPNNDDHVAVAWGGLCFATDGCRQKAREQGDQAR